MKNFIANFFFSILGRVSKLAVVINFKLIFCVNLLALKFGICVINIKMILCQKFHDHMAVFQL